MAERFDPQDALTLYQEAWLTCKALLPKSLPLVVPAVCLAYVIELLYNMLFHHVAAPSGHPPVWLFALRWLQALAALLPLAVSLMCLLVHEQEDAFSTGRVLQRLCHRSLVWLLSSVVYVACVLLGSVLILPGLYLLVAMMFYMLYVLEHGHGPWQALRASMALTHRCWWWTTVTLLAPAVLLVVSFYGVLMSLPLGWQVGVQALAHNPLVHWATNSLLMVFFACLYRGLAGRLLTLQAQRLAEVEARASTMASS